MEENTIAIEEAKVEKVNTTVPPMPEQKDEKPKKKKKGKKVAIVFLCLILIGGLIAGGVFLYQTDKSYKNAVANKETSPISSYYTFEKISWYKDAEELLKVQKDVVLAQAIKQTEKKEFSTAQSYLDFLGDYPGVKDAQKELTYAKGVDHYGKAQYGSAKVEFDKIKGYKDVDEYLDKFIYKLGWYMLNQYDAYQRADIQAIDVGAYRGQDTIYVTYRNGEKQELYYAFLESNEEYQCSYGDYEICIIGRKLDGGSDLIFDSVAYVIGIDDPHIDENGIVDKLYVDGEEYTEIYRTRV